MNQHEVSDLNLDKNKCICFELSDIWFLNFSFKRQNHRSIHNRNVVELAHCIVVELARCIVVELAHCIIVINTLELGTCLGTF